MPIHPKYLADFCEGQFFHVYNRTNGSHKLFREEENCRFFLAGFEEHLTGVLDIYSYCLLPSHFHAIIKIKRLMEMEEFLNSIKNNTRDINKIVLKQFRSFFISYTMAFNKYFNRQGSLFNHKFRRVAIESLDQLKDCIFYVHSNPVHHSLTKNFLDYSWSSYPLILSDEPTDLKREEVLELFGGREEFIQFHSNHRAVIAKPDIGIRSF